MVGCLLALGIWAAALKCCNDNPGLQQHTKQAYLASALRLPSLGFRFEIQPKSEWQPPKGAPFAYNLTSPIICHNPPSKCGACQADHLSNSSWHSVPPTPKYELSELSGQSALNCALPQQHSKQLCMP
eukprot:jgi/Chrzof1/12535/Cz06g37210.t1